MQPRLHIVIAQAHDNIGSAMSVCKQPAVAFALCVIARSETTKQSQTRFFAGSSITPSPRGSAPKTPHPLVMPHTDAASPFHTIKKIYTTVILKKSEVHRRRRTQKAVSRAFTLFAATLRNFCLAPVPAPLANGFRYAGGCSVTVFPRNRNS